MLVIGATNRKDDLDDALLRPGRFDRFVHMGLPAAEQRFRILQARTLTLPCCSRLEPSDPLNDCFQDPECGYMKLFLKLFGTTHRSISVRSLTFDTFKTPWYMTQTEGETC